MTGFPTDRRVYRVASRAEATTFDPKRGPGVPLEDPGD
jgi:hypothetical protein